MSSSATNARIGSDRYVVLKPLVMMLFTIEQNVTPRPA